MKHVVTVRKSPAPHWVGDGLLVRGVFSYRDFGAAISPFLLLDYAAPFEVAPAPARRGVGEHPHRGFETVTIVYQGELEHRDSAGNAGRIGPGDVQWMTAASGVVHEEMHGEAIARNGGTLQFVQLWVNLPAGAKMSPPAYQTLMREDIPTVPLPDGAGTVRVISGEFGGTKGPARTFTPVNVWDVRLAAGKTATLPVPAGYTAAVLVLSGTVAVEGEGTAGETDFILFDQDGEDVTMRAEEDATLLVMSGEPINEPIAAYGPFVMNTEAEIRQAFEDYRTGRMGALSPA